MSSPIRSLQAYVITPPPVESRVRQVNAYAITGQPVISELRKISGVVLYEDAPIAVVRTIYGLALIADVSKTYLKMKGAVALLTAINKEHGKTLTAVQVSFADPAPSDDPSFNTTVAMLPAPDWLYSGQMVFRYERYALEELFRNESLTLPVGNQTTVHERLAGVNSAFGCNLEPRDVVDGPVAANATGFTLTVASTSYLFLPGTSIRLGAPPPVTDLAQLSPNTDLAGFDAEG